MQGATSPVGYFVEFTSGLERLCNVYPNISAPLYIFAVFLFAFCWSLWSLQNPPVLSRNLLPVWGSAPKIEIKLYKSEKKFTEHEFFLNFAQRSYLRSSRGMHNLGSWARGEPKFLGVIFFIVTIFSETLQKNGGFWCRIWKYWDSSTKWYTGNRNSVSHLSLGLWDMLAKLWK